MRRLCARVITAVGVGVAALVGGPFAAAQSVEPAVFVANNVSDEVTAFTINPDGTLNRVGLFPASDGPIAMSLSPDGRYLAVTHGTGNEQEEVIILFEVQADASLVNVFTGTVPNAPLGVLWVDDDSLAVTQTSVGGQNFVHVYDWDAGAGTLTLIDSEVTGQFNTHLAIRPMRDFLYAQDSFGNVIRSFLVNPDSTLLMADVVSTTPWFALDMTVTHDGTKLYAACGISGDGHRVLGYALDDKGTLIPLSEEPFFSPGESPAHVMVSSDDSLLFVGHGTDATVWSFFINDDGSITSTGHMFDVGLQGTIGDIAILGDWLFVTDESTAIDDRAGLYSFTIHPDGSFTLNAPIYDTLGVRPETIAVWAGLVGGLPGDFDGDGDVDIADFAFFTSCFTGSGIPCSGDCCAADLDGDGDVDIADFAIFAANFTGSQ